jgi:chaperone BCS1
MSITEMQRECSVKASDTAKAVVYYIEKNLHQIQNVRALKEIFVSSFFAHGFDESLPRSTQNIVDQDSCIKVDDNIYCRISMIKEEKDKYKITNITISLFSDKNIKYIKAFVDKCLQEYKQDMQNKVHTNKYIFILNSSENNELKYTQVEFTSNKTFDNMFFSDKQKIIDRLDFFMHKKTEYDKVGMPYTLGFLLHGAPGVGKSSAIKAIANYTNRHVIVIPTQLVKDNETLTNVFLTNRINNLDVPYSKRIYVFEEIDCGAWRDIIRDRNLEPIKPIKTLEEIEVKEKNETICFIDNKDKNNDQPIVISTAKPENKKTTLTLGNILELLDGIVETSGRIIIFTSNFPQDIDKALMRPGRINCVIEFKKLIKEEINSMFNLWFNKNIPEQIFDKVKDYTFSQADIGEMFIQHFNDHETIYKKLTY